MYMEKGTDKPREWEEALAPGGELAVELVLSGDDATGMVEGGEDGEERTRTADEFHDHKQQGKKGGG